MIISMQMRLTDLHVHDEILVNQLVQKLDTFCFLFILYFFYIYYISQRN